MEGPQIHLYARTLFPRVIGFTLTDAEGERVDRVADLLGSELLSAEPLGKRLWLRFAGHDDVRLTLHCLMFGDVRLDRDRGKRLTLRLWFEKDGERRRVDLYLGAAKVVPAAEFDAVPATRDVMHPDSDPAATLAEVAGRTPDRTVGDVLLDQTWFPGLGNVIRVEALFEAGVHPDRTAASLTAVERDALAAGVSRVAGEFYDAVAARGDHAHPVRRVHKGKLCPRCGGDLKKEKLGEDARTAWWCPVCQPPDRSLPRY